RKRVGLIVRTGPRQCNINRQRAVEQHRIAAACSPFCFDQLLLGVPVNISLRGAMRIESVNVSLSREVILNGRAVTTGMFKEPVSGRIELRSLNLEGDQQADLSVHGGPEKAVYAYPAEHYPYWRAELPDMALPYGMFAENLTTQGLDES